MLCEDGKNKKNDKNIKKDNKKLTQKQREQITGADSGRQQILRIRAFNVLMALQARPIMQKALTGAGTGFP